MRTAAMTGLIDSAPPAAMVGHAVVPRRTGLGWTELPLISQLYVLSVTLAGAYALFTALPHQLPQPFLFFGLHVAETLGTGIARVESAI